MPTKKYGTALTVLTCLLLCLVLGMAFFNKIFKARPAADAGFLPHAEWLTEQRDRFPFHKVWRKPGGDRNRFTELLVRPVNTQFLFEMPWIQQAGGSGINFAKDIQRVAVFCTNKLKEAFNNDPNHRLKVVQSISPKTVVLEMAIVEILPTKDIYEKLGLSSLGTGTIGQGSIAFEARVRDGKTNEILAMMADRELGKTNTATPGGITWYSHTDSVIEEWARQFVELMNTPLDHQVKDSAPFQLSIWE